MKTSNLIALLFAAVALYSCKGGGSAAMDYESSDSALVTADSTAPKQAKLVKTADITFKVKNVPQTCEQVSNLTAQYQGMVMHHQMRADIQNSRDVALGNDSVRHISAFNTTADMTIKVPTEKLNDFMNKVGHMSQYVTLRRMDIEDKSLDYLESQLKLNSRNELVRQQKTGRITIKDPEEVLYFKDELVDQQIYKRRVDDAVKYSVVTLSFHQSNTIVQETIVNDDPAAYNTPFISRFGLALSNGLQIFAEVILVLTNLWVFILAGLGAWLIIRIYRKRNNTLMPSKPLTGV
jgi:hypothetical protein